MASRLYASGLPGPMLPQHSGRSMVPSLLDLLGWSHAWPASRFSSPVMFLRSPTPGNSEAAACGATVGGAEVVVVLVGAAVWLEVVAARVAHATTATTVSVMNAYDSATPIRARLR